MLRASLNHHVFWCHLCHWCQPMTGKPRKYKFNVTLHHTISRLWWHVPFVFVCHRSNSTKILPLKWCFIGSFTWSKFISTIYNAKHLIYAPNEEFLFLWNGTWYKKSVDFLLCWQCVMCHGAMMVGPIMALVVPKKWWLSEALRPCLL